MGMIWPLHTCLLSRLLFPLGNVLVALRVTCTSHDEQGIDVEEDYIRVWNCLQLMLRGRSSRPQQEIHYLSLSKGEYGSSLHC